MNETTHIGFLGDESGSMSGNRQAMIEGFNEFVGSVKKDTNAKNVRLTLGFFDLRGDADVLRIKLDGHLRDCRELSEDDYRPYGSTPLNDAIVQMVSRMEKHGADKKLLVIFTDGLENASETSTKDVRKLIARKESEGWEFIYLGANQDAWSEGSQRGIGKSRSYNFDASPQGTHLTMAKASQLASLRVTLSSKKFADAADQLHEASDGRID